MASTEHFIPMGNHEHNYLIEHDPEMRAAADALKAGAISRDEYADFVQHQDFIVNPPDYNDAFSGELDSFDKLARLHKYNMIPDDVYEEMLRLSEALDISWL